jgi:hypothetical protein
MKNYEFGMWKAEKEEDKEQGTEGRKENADFGMGNGEKGGGALRLRDVSLSLGWRSAAFASWLPPTLIQPSVTSSRK